MARFTRRQALAAGGAAAAALLDIGCEREPRPAPRPEPSAPTPSAAFELAEMSLAELARALAEGRYRSRQLVEMYLERIEALDRDGPMLRAFIETSHRALATADRLDAERKAGRVRGPLHGIPIAVKDNIATADDTETTAGSLALVGAKPARDAFVIARLREAGAIVLGKANLSEWANIRSRWSVSGWSARGGLCKSPYALDRNPCGSSSGSAVAVATSMTAAALGTETDGSIICPSSANGIVGLKPTLGLVSRSGVIPITLEQDTVGPMGRTVADVATLLGAMAGADPDDAATRSSERRDYHAALTRGALQGARIGVARQHMGFHPEVDALFEGALAAMRVAGAELLDPAPELDLATLGRIELEALLFELVPALEAYLKSLPASPVRTLADVIAFNERHGERELALFGQDLFERAAKMKRDDASLERVRQQLRRAAREEGLEPMFAKHRLAALAAPSGGPAWSTDTVNGDHFLGGSSSPAAVAGYPHITVPMGQIRGLPVGLSLMGRPFDEPRLLGLAHDFEQITRLRRPPTLRATVDPG